MLQEVGDRANEAIMLIVLGRCKTALGEYAHAITCHNQRWALVQELHLMNEQASTALELGVVTWAKARVEHRDAARGASLGHSGGAAFLFASPTAGGVGQLDGPAPAAPVFTFAAASGIRRPKAYMDSMHDAAQWLETALRLVETHGSYKTNEGALLHLSFVAFDTVGHIYMHMNMCVYTYIYIYTLSYMYVYLFI